MRLIWWLVIGILIVPLTNAAMLNCKNVMTSQDIPCQILSSTNYKDGCDTYTIKFYNSTPALVGQHAMDTWTDGITDGDRCNATFNFSQYTDTYIFNISKNGDSGSFYVEVDDDMNTAIIIILGGFAILFIGIGVYMLLKNREEKDAESSSY